MRIYNATRFLFPRSYRLRVFAICFGSVHIPLITFLVIQGLRGQWDWSMITALLIATVVGTGVAIVGLAGLLAPIQLAMDRLAQLQRGESVEDCPEAGQDLAGDLLRATTEASQSTIRRIDRLKGAAATDALTGLANRRGLLEKLGEKMQNGSRGSIALLDGDRFKQVNDRLGHSEGDRLLKRIASRILDNVRESDIAGRWGGDEFVIYFDGLDRDGAIAAITRIKGAVLRRSPILLDGEPVAFSHGCASLETPGRKAFDRALEEADKELYRDKARRMSA
ncbi:GGDEF domain-containing protein [Pseudoblastomonas halimionae]|uniref:diguanylate cyclase n=1 Tax=Alteriqipengyuania halimionae TaxID=1926630 RepID=A0A6I4U4T6_9SPHN|nr:GGDEF domain-containing protein [Alteriqipengyuania halimionae]MXP11129.1 diguanylate cyclase [Alteriqipengyuania halimionae]